MKINEVEYLDFNQDATFTEEGKEAYTKRDAFIHEQEVRAIYTDRTTKDKGISVKIDLTELVDEIRYSPLAPTKHIDFLKNYFKTKNLNITLTQSELEEEPF